jgi:hypothetical protein
MVRNGRRQCLEMLRSRLRAAVDKGELPASTDVDCWSRFYLGVFQGMAIQAHDGATSAELEGMVRTAMAAWPGPSSPTFAPADEDAPAPALALADA